ncbi:MAG: hypothetical protein WBP79_01365 [Candidatus Acidiferrales bacterium]
MRRTLAAAGLAFVCFGAAALTASAQSLPTLDEATALVLKAIATTNLGPGNKQPFHLVAKVRYTIDSKTIEGTCEFYFAAPDRYREEYHIGKITEIEVALNDKLYISRSPRTPTPAVWRIGTLLRFPGSPVRNAPVKAVRVYGGASPDSNGICVDASDQIFDREACFDPETRDVLRLTTGTKEHNKVVGFTEELKLRDFLTVASLRYPMRMERISSWDKIEIEVEKLTAETTFDEHLFDPPPKAAVHDWCSIPTIQYPPQPLAMQAFVGFDEPAVYYFIVDKQGHAKNVLSLRA